MNAEKLKKFLNEELVLDVSNVGQLSSSWTMFQRLKHKRSKLISLKDQLVGLRNTTIKASLAEGEEGIMTAEISRLEKQDSKRINQIGKLEERI